MLHRLTARTLLIASLAASGRARAEDPVPAPAPEAGAASPHEREVRFSADRVDLDAELEELVLRGRVQVVVDRYRLSGDRLHVHRGPSGIVVDGDGRVAFCPCPVAPLTFGFRKATVAPPTDLLLEDPTLRIGDVPVAWMPYLWLRSPSRPGLLPPKVALRGRDGLLAGAGVHLPLSADAPDEPRSGTALDLRAAGYLQGGAEVEGRVVSRRSMTSVRWDHLRESLLAVDAFGAHRGIGGETVAWSADAIRGPRGLRGTILLEDAARRYDRAEVLAGAAGPVGTFGVGMRADAVRGGPLGSADAIGPRLHAGLGTALGSVGAAAASLDARTYDGPGLAAASTVLHRGGAQLSARPGPLAVSAEARSLAAATVGEDEQGRGGALGVQGRVGAPLVRDYGARSDPVQHWVEPFVEAGLGASDARGTFLLPWTFPQGAFVNATAGGETLLGGFGRRTGASLSARAGWVGNPRDPVVAALFRASARTSLLALVSDVGWLPSAERSMATVTRGRLGREDGWHVGGYAAGRIGDSAVVARAIEQGGWDAPLVGWLDTSGWTAGSRVGAAWTSWLASAVAADYDATQRALLGVRGSVGYRHPCGCLAIVGWAGRRLGRDGVDAWVTADLVP